MDTSLMSKFDIGHQSVKIEDKTDFKGHILNQDWPIGTLWLVCSLRLFLCIWLVPPSSHSIIWNILTNNLYGQFDLPSFEQYNRNIGNDQSKQKTIGIAHLEPKVVILAPHVKIDVTDVFLNLTNLLQQESSIRNVNPRGWPSVQGLFVQQPWGANFRPFWQANNRYDKNTQSCIAHTQKQHNNFAVAYTGSNGAHKLPGVRSIHYKDFPPCTLARFQTNVHACASGTEQT